jgi:autotransporter-associated beta strand protein
MRGDYLSIRASILLAAAVSLMATPALALVQHPNTSTILDNEEPPVMSDRPNNAVVGWWNYNASAVAIKPNYIITTCHQLSGVGTTVNFGGVDYRVAEVFQHGKADLRIARIVNPTTGADANLTNYVDYYKDTNEEDKTAVIGGFGRGRGTIYPTYYTWAVSDNKTQRWGRNKLDGNGLNSTAFVSDVLTAHFENRGDPNWVEYEAAVAEYDSGGGWFLKDGVTGLWQVAGLSRGADNPSSFNPAAYMDCVRVSSYATWLNNAFSPSKWNSSLGGDWSIAGNWSGGVPTGLDKWAVFSDKVPDSRMVTLDAGHTIGTLRFDCLGSLTIAAGGSNKLTFQVTNKADGSSADAAQIETGNTNGNGALTITAPVTMSTPLVVRHNSGGTLTISGEVTGNSLTKAGTGTLVLSGTNTYTGATTVSAGTLQFAKRASLYNSNPASWTATNLVVASGATAAFNVGGTGEFAAANINTLKALGTGAGGFKSGAILGLDTANAAGGNFAYSSAIGNPNGGANILGLTKLGANTLTLSGASTYTGATSVSGGILKAGIASVAGTSGAFGKNSAVTLANTAGVSMDITGFNTQIGSLAGGGATGGNVTLGAATLTVGGNNASPAAYAGVISGTGGALTKIGSGTLTLSGANTFSGGVTLSAGTLKLGSTTALGATAGTFTIGGGTTLDSTVAGLVNAKNNPIIINGDFAFAGTNNLSLGTGAVSLGAAAGTSRTITVNAGTLTLGGAISNGTTATTLVKAGIGTLTTAAIAAGTVNHNAGTLNAASVTSTNLNAYSTANVTGAVTLTGTATVGNGTDAAMLTASTLRAGELSIKDKGFVQTAINGTANETSKVTKLTFAGDEDNPLGQLDLRMGKFIIEYSPTTLPGEVEEQVRILAQSGYEGRGVNGNLYWDGNGIISSDAAADSTYLHAFALIDNRLPNPEDPGNPSAFTDMWGGESVTMTSILGMYTYVGDANMDGEVNTGDYGQIDNGFNSGLTGWRNGDFNYDGVVDTNDYGLIDNAYNTLHPDGGVGGGISEIGLGLGEVPEPAAGLALDLGNGSPLSGGTVPEPMTVFLLGTGVLALAVRRRWPQKAPGRPLAAP